MNILIESEEEDDPLEMVEEDWLKTHEDQPFEKKNSIKVKSSWGKDHQGKKLMGQSYLTKSGDDKSQVNQDRRS